MAASLPVSVWRREGADEPRWVAGHHCIRLDVLAYHRSATDDGVRADLHRPGDQHVSGQPSALTDLDVVPAARDGLLSIKAELVYLVHPGENADVVPEKHVRAHGDMTATGVEDRRI